MSSVSPISIGILSVFDQQMANQQRSQQQAARAATPAEQLADGLTVVKALGDIRKQNTDAVVAEQARAYATNGQDGTPSMFSQDIGLITGTVPGTRPDELHRAVARLKFYDPTAAATYNSQISAAFQRVGQEYAASKAVMKQGILPSALLDDPEAMLNYMAEASPGKAQVIYDYHASRNPDFKDSALGKSLAKSIGERADIAMLNNPEMEAMAELPLQELVQEYVGSLKTTAEIDPETQGNQLAIRLVLQRRYGLTDVDLQSLTSGDEKLAAKTLAEKTQQETEKHSQAMEKGRLDITQAKIKNERDKLSLAGEKVSAARSAEINAMATGADSYVDPTDGKTKPASKFIVTNYGDGGDFMTAPTQFTPVELMSHILRGERVQLSRDGGQVALLQDVAKRLGIPEAQALKITSAAMTGTRWATPQDQETRGDMVRGITGAMAGLLFSEKPKPSQIQSAKEMVKLIAPMAEGNPGTTQLLNDLSKALDNKETTE